MKLDHIFTDEHHDVHDLASLKQIARMLGVPDNLTSRVANWHTYDLTFPAPVAKFGATNVWSITEVFRWCEPRRVKVDKEVVRKYLDGVAQSENEKLR